jgi:hypothetical protein
MKLEPPMSYDKFPDRLSRPMSRGQAVTLRTLSVEAYQPRLFEENLTQEESGSTHRGAAPRNRAGQLVLNSAVIGVAQSVV